MDVEHYDGRTLKTDLYYLASRVFFRTLARAYSNHAMDIYEKPYGVYYDITKDYIQEVACTIYCGYTNKKGEHFQGYTDGVKSFRQLALVGYKAINAMLYANGIQGRNIGKVITVSDNILIDLVAKYEYHKHNTSNINIVRYNQFIKDVQNNLTIKQLEVFNLMLNNQYISDTYKFNQIDIANTLHITIKSTQRRIERIKQTIQIVVKNYNMNIDEFITYLQTA